MFEHHLNAFAIGLDELMSDDAEDAVLMLPDITHRGHAAIQAFFDGFISQSPPSMWTAFRIRHRAVHGSIAYLVWDAMPLVALATDTFHVLDGHIVAQTFTSYTPSASRAPA